MRHTQLRAFDQVAREGSFSDAAQRIGVTQPALTIQVRNLEKSYGLSLFTRSGDGVHLTAAGERLFQLTQEMFDVEDRITHFLTAARDLETGELRLAADGPHLVTRLIAAFQNAYPGIRVSLSLGNAAAAWDNLAQGRADVVVAADAPNTSANHTVMLQHSRLVAVVAADHPWAARDKVALRDLAGERTVVRERRSNTQRMVSKLLRQRRVALGHRLELDSREAVIEAVAAGLGVGFIFASEATPDPRIRTVELSDVVTRNTEVVGCLQAQRRDSIVRAFLETVAAWRTSGP